VPGVRLSYNILIYKVLLNNGENDPCISDSDMQGSSLDNRLKIKNIFKSFTFIHIWFNKFIDIKSNGYIQYTALENQY